MKVSIVAAMALAFVPLSAKAIIIPPGGHCCPECLCEQSKQLIVVPAFFPLSTQTDATQPTDWNRINNVGAWVGLIVAGDSFETAVDQDDDLHYAPTTQRTLGYVYTGHGGVDTGTVMNHVGNWNRTYGSSYVQGIFFDVGPTFDPGQVPSVTAAYETTPQPSAFPGNPAFQGYQGYYHTLYTGTHSSYSFEVMVNASQWPNEWIVSPTSGTQGADRALLWEDSLDNYNRHWGAIPCGSPNGTCTGNVTNPPPGWWASSTYTAQYEIGHTIFAATQLDVSTAVQRSWTPVENRTASLVYLYDRPQATYSGVSCFFEQEVNALGGNFSGPQSTWCGSCSGNTCTGSCHDLRSEHDNFGSCDNACVSNHSCVGGSCVCPPNYIDCGDTCIHSGTQCP